MLAKKMRILKRIKILQIKFLLNLNMRPINYKKKQNKILIFKKFMNKNNEYIYIYTNLYINYGHIK
jgi:hypothetical protein